MYVDKIIKNADKPMKQEILAEAGRMLLNDGYPRFSMRRLASNLGVSPTTLYTYFSSKEDIIFCVRDDVHLQILDLLKNAIDKNLGPAENIKNCIRAYARYGFENLDQYKIAFLTFVDEEIPGFFSKDANGMTAYGLVRGLAESITDDADKAAQSIWSLVHGMVVHMLLHPRFPWENKDELINFAVDSLIKGICGEKQ